MIKEITWQEVYARIREAPPGSLFGIPRGGAIVAGLTYRAVDQPENADYIIDDILDSGATKERYSHFKKPFWSLIDKQREGLGDKWIRLPWEHEDAATDLKDTVIRQLEYIGEDPNREGLRDTPARVLRSLKELTEGYQQDPAEILSTVFTESYDQMISVRDIPFSSLCEHHMLPFIGTATVAYIPTGKVVGLSKIARLVHCYARRLQIQERLTNQIAESIHEVLKPHGVAVMLRASHSCMTLRGVKSSADFVTSCLLGYFRDRQDTRNEFLRLCR